MRGVLKDSVRGVEGVAGDGGAAAVVGVPGPGVVLGVSEASFFGVLARLEPLCGPHDFANMRIKKNA